MQILGALSSWTVLNGLLSVYLRRIRRRSDPTKRWLAFLQNHREAIVASDFFTVPTVTFQLLSCFFVIEHSRRRILHCNVNCHPTAEWVVQQLREAFPQASPYRYAIFDQDSKFDSRVARQNGVCERWVGSCRREILDHVIAWDEQHLRRLIRDDVSYYNQDRIHDSLEKDAPNRRSVEPRPTATATVISMPRLGGLHHRYARREAA